MAKRAPRIVSVNIRGRDEKSPAGGMERESLMRGVASWLVYHQEHHPIDAVVFPGGFGFLPHPTDLHGMADYRTARKRNGVAGSGIALAAYSLIDRMADYGEPPKVIAGFDTGPYCHGSKRVGGQQLAVAFGAEGIDGVARKIFPVDEDVDGKTMPPFVLHEQDFADAARFVALPNGSKAVLCVCYDMFGVADAVRGLKGKLAKAAYVADRRGHLVADQQGKQKILNRAFDSFGRLLKAEKPDIAISTIHRFAGPGRDVFWQRHGIAAASAALGRLTARPAFAVAAAHVGALTDNDKALRLAAYDVPADHLNARAQRKAHAIAPVSQASVTGAGDISATIRVFAP